jgi:hypothetical protein
MLEQQGQLDLGLEDISLASLARTELRVRNLHKLSDQLHLFMMNLDRLLREEQIVVGLLEAGDQLPFLRTDRLLGHLGRTTRHIAFEREFAGKGKILRETEDIVLRLHDVEVLGKIPQLDGQDWVIQ